MRRINWHFVTYETTKMMRYLNPRGNFRTPSPEERERWTRFDARSRLEFLDYKLGKFPVGSLGYETRRVIMPNRPTTPR